MRRPGLTVGFVAVAALVLAAGCAGPEFYQRSHKPNLNAATQTQYMSSNYEVLGLVRVVGEGICILGVYAGGRDGEGLLWEQAQMLHAGNFTGIKDIAAWSEWQAILPPLMSQIKTTYIGTVVRERRAAPAAPAP